MAADLDAFAAFINSLPPGDPIGLPDGPAMTQEGFLEVFNEVLEARNPPVGMEQEGLQNLADEAADWARRNPEHVDQELLDILGLVDEDTEPDDAEAANVALLLQQMGVNATTESGAAFLSALELLRGAQGEPAAPEPVAAAPAPAAAPVRTTRRVARVVTAPGPAVAPPAATGRPKDVPFAAIRYPEPANPPPFVPVTLEQLQGIPRNGAGKYDSGAL